MDGWSEGYVDGCFEGCLDGCVDGFTAGALDGDLDGILDDSSVGELDGWRPPSVVVHSAGTLCEFVTVCLLSSSELTSFSFSMLGVKMSLSDLICAVLG